MKASLAAGLLIIGGCASVPKGVEGCREVAARAGHDLSRRPDSYPIAHTSARLLTWVPLVGGPPGGTCVLVDGRVTELTVGGERLIP